jgi:hypothetical protein
MKFRPRRRPIQPSNGVPSMVPLTRWAGTFDFEKLAATPIGSCPHTLSGENGTITAATFLWPMKISASKRIVLI